MSSRSFIAAANKLRLILDPNIIISGILFKSEVLRTVLARAFGDHEVVFSSPAWDGLCEVISQEQIRAQPGLGRAVTSASSTRAAGQAD